MRAVTRLRLLLAVAVVAAGIGAPASAGGSSAPRSSAEGPRSTATWRPPVIRPADLHDEAATRATTDALAAGPFASRTGDVRAASPPVYAYSAVAGVLPDVTGDRRDDVLQVAVMGPRSFTLRDGATGRARWSVHAEQLLHPLVAGRGAAAGAVLISQAISYDAATGLVRTGLVALDGPTGAERWRIEADGYPWAGVYLVGTSRRPSGPDAVLAVGLAATGYRGTPGVAIPLVLDASSGLPLHQGPPLALTDGISMTSTPDLDADGVPDSAVATTGEHTVVSARSGVTGAELWSAPSTGVGSYGYLVALPGSGRPVVQLVEGLDDTRTVLTGYDGVTGRQRWTRVLDELSELGDADGDGSPDVLSSRFDYHDGKLLLTGVSALTGRTLWRTSVRKPVERHTEWSATPERARDLDGDRARDVLVRMHRYQPHGWTEVHQVLVSGRDGARRVLSGLTGRPLHGSLRRGRGAFVNLAPSGRQARIAARDLAGTVWSAALPVPDLEGAVEPQVGAFRGPGQRDVLVTVYGRERTYLLALDGRTGAQLWCVDVSR